MAKLKRLLESDTDTCLKIAQLRLCKTCHRSGFNKMVVHLTQPEQQRGSGIFGDRIITINSNNPYPTCSPDLTAPDCVLEERIYVNKRTPNQLKEKIRQEIKLLNEQTNLFVYFEATQLLPPLIPK